MIRRTFWLGTGAVLGVTGYRKAVRLARLVTGPAGGLAGRRAGARPAGARIRSAAVFARDVREGMAEYRDLRDRQPGRSLATSVRPGEARPGPHGQPQTTSQ